MSMNYMLIRMDPDKNSNAAVLKEITVPVQMMDKKQTVL